MEARAGPIAVAMAGSKAARNQIGTNTRPMVSTNPTTIAPKKAPRPMTSKQNTVRATHVIHQFTSPRAFNRWRPRSRRSRWRTGRWATTSSCGRRSKPVPRWPPSRAGSSPSAGRTAWRTWKFVGGACQCRRRRAPIPEPSRLEIPPAPRPPPASFTSATPRGTPRAGAMREPAAKPARDAAGRRVNPRRRQPAVPVFFPP